MSSSKSFYDDESDSRHNSGPIPILKNRSEYEIIISRLQERVDKLEASLKKTQIKYSQSLTELFSSFPAKASVVESGSIQQPFSPHAKLEVSFGKRFPDPPKVIAWIVIKDKITENSSSPGSPKTGPAAAAAGGSAGGSQKSMASPRLSHRMTQGSINFFNIEDELGTEVIKIRPNYITVNNINDNKRVTFVIPSYIEMAAGTPERKHSAMLYWVAWNPQKFNPKISSCIQKLKSEIQSCIEECGSINATDSIGQTILHTAACTGNIDLVTWLLHKGADIDWSDTQGWTPLLGAISSQQAETAFFLLKKGASVHGTCERGMTCLHLLARWPTTNAAQEKLARDLVAAGLDINSRNEAGETPLLHLCRKRENCVPFATLLINLHADPKMPDFSGQTPLHMAAFTNNVNLARLLIAYGASLESVGPNGTPLMTAMYKRHKEVMTLLAGPNDITRHDALLERIMAMLAPADLHRAMMTCRKFRTICAKLSSNNEYWIERCGAPKAEYVEYHKLVKGFAYRMNATSTNGFLIPRQAADQAQQAPQPQLANMLRIAVAVLGGPAVGKSNLLLGICGDGGEEGLGPFASIQVEAQASLESRCYGKMSVRANIKGQCVEIVLVEIPFAAKVTEANEIAQLWKFFAGCMVLADTTKKNDAFRAIGLVSKWEELCTPSMARNVVVCGTKSDCEHKGIVLNSLDMMKFCDERNIQYYNVSMFDVNSFAMALKTVCDKISIDNQSLASAVRLLGNHNIL